jgi:histidyl-tRNA synthetase
MKDYYKTLPGFKDILEEEYEEWLSFIEAAREIFHSYNFFGIETPILEAKALFSRSIGEFTDIVDKEMFEFIDRGGREVALRPEGTAGIVRAYVENGYYSKSLTKWYYMGPMFRAEKPQKGRYREFHQIGVEVIGSYEPFYDFEVIKLANELISLLGIEDYTLHINSIGCKKCRLKFKEALLESLLPHRDALCDDCKRRLTRSPIRVLDCKKEGCRSITKKYAPKIRDYLCDDCKRHYERVKTYLEKAQIKYVEDDFLVRGLDYYTKTTFEFKSSLLGGQDTFIAGGRYDYLVGEIGGHERGAVGFAGGLERMFLLKKRSLFPRKKKMFVVYQEEDYKDYAFMVLEQVRSMRRYVVDWFPSGGRIQKQLRKADRLGFDYAIIVGEDEVRDGKISLKDLHTGEQRLIDLEELSAL